MEPLRTIGAAVALTQPGDIVTVLEGDYRGDSTAFGIGVIPILNSGTQSDPVRLRAADGAEVTVSKVLMQDASDWIIEGFDFRGLDFSAFDGWSPMPRVVRTIDPNLPRPDFTQPFATRETRIREEFAIYFSILDELSFSSGVDLEKCQRVLVQENDVRGYFAGIQCRGCNQIQVHDNTIRECANGVFTFYAGDGAPGLLDSTIQGNDIQQCLDNGIDIRAESTWVYVDDNELAFNGRSHISLQDGASRCRVRFNSARNGGYYSETMKFPGSSGISMNDTGVRNFVTDNYVAMQFDLTGIDGNGIIIDRLRDGAFAIVDRNISANNEGAGLNLTLGAAVVRRNVFLRNGRYATEPRRGAGIKISRDEDVGNVIVNNTLAWNRAAGILASGNIQQQALVESNRYITSGEPLIWDGFEVGDRDYRTLIEVQLITDHERRGQFWRW